MKTGIKFCMIGLVVVSFVTAVRAEDSNRSMKTMVEAGLMVPETDQQAVQWFRESPGQTEADIFYNLGMSYSLRLIPDPTDIEAGRWLRKAADRGHQEAKQYLELKAQLKALGGR